MKHRRFSVLITGTAIITFISLILYSFIVSNNPERYLSSLPEPYPFFMVYTSEDLVSAPAYALDSQGVIQSDYHGRYGEEGMQYNPTLIARYAYALFREYLVDPKKENKKLDKFLIQANWLVDNLSTRDDFGVWLYNFDQPTFGATNPWASAMAQGMGLSVLIEAHALTGENKYLEAAEKAYRSFLVDMEEGGVRTSVGKHSYVYEEVADENAPSSKILNGFIFALAGLYDYWQYTSRGDVRRTFDQGVNGLQLLLSEYDAEIISLYDLHFRRLSRRGAYNLVHVDQLLWLYGVTNDPQFLHYVLKFYSYERFVPYTVASKGSTDPEGHGPENLYLEGKYWSHNEFPTWVELDLGKVQTISQFTFFGYTEESTPRDYDICFLHSRMGLQKCISVENNTIRIRTHLIPDLDARYIKLEIFSDNGNKNVALVGFGIETIESSDWPVAVSDCRPSLYGNHPPKYLVDGDLNTYWEHTYEDTCNIWVDFRAQVPSDRVYFEGNHSDKFRIWASNNLIHWTQISTSKMLENFRYFKYETLPGALIREIRVIDDS